MLAMHRVQSRYFLVILRCEVEIFKTLPEEIAQETMGVSEIAVNLYKRYAALYRICHNKRVI